MEVPVDDDQLIRVEATGTLSYTVMGLTHGEMYSFEVRAHNAAGWGAASGPVEVTLNTAPEVMGEASPSFDEDSEQPVATYTATDAEGDAITWSLTGADAAAFSPPSDAAGNSFDLSFRSAPNYETPTDANLDTVYEVTVVATAHESPGPEALNFNSFNLNDGGKHHGKGKNDGHQPDSGPPARAGRGAAGRGYRLCSLGLPAPGRGQFVDLRGGPRNSDSYVRWIQPLYGRTGDMGKRRSFSAQFKAKVALEALVGDQTLAELAAKHHLHPNVIAQWKRQARESLPEVFARKTSSRAADHEAEVKALHAKIGQLTVENDFLSRAFGR